VERVRERHRRRVSQKLSCVPSLRSQATTVRATTQRLLLHLRHTFAISRGAEDIAQTVLFTLCVDGVEAVGEAAPIARYDETPESVAHQLARLPLQELEWWYFDATLARLRDWPAARCALDLALYDLAGKRLGVPVYRLLGLDPTAALRTSFTIGIADIEKTIAKVKEAAAFPILKVKVGGPDTLETLEAIRSCYRGSIRVDANEAWSPDEAVRMLREIERFDVEFCEQPIPAGHPEQLRFVRERVKLPIIVDEDSVVATDVPRLAGCIDGINIKLAKCGGIREALRMIAVARALGMKIMIGCMIESSILATAAAHVTPLCDYADLDGPLLITDDPFRGVDYDGAQLRLPATPGLGVRPASMA
jgi:L-alanine-DL-glutamate epimerase-like enolase superfamily enzyme